MNEKKLSLATSGEAAEPIDIINARTGSMSLRDITNLIQEQTGVVSDGYDIAEAHNLDLIPFAIGTVESVRVGMQDNFSGDGLETVMVITFGAVDGTKFDLYCRGVLFSNFCRAIGCKYRNSMDVERATGNNVNEFEAQNYCDAMTSFATNVLRGRSYAVQYLGMDKVSKKTKRHYKDFDVNDVTEILAAYGNNAGCAEMLTPSPDQMRPRDSKTGQFIDTDTTGVDEDL